MWCVNVNACECECECVYVWKRHVLLNIGFVSVVVVVVVVIFVFIVGIIKDICRYHVYLYLFSGERFHVTMLVGIALVVGGRSSRWIKRIFDDKSFVSFD